MLPILKIDNKDFPHFRSISLVVICNLPKNPLLDKNSLNDKADTSYPFSPVRFANSTTGLLGETILLLIFIETPKALHKRK